MHTKVPPGANHALLGTSYAGYQPALMERLLPLVDALEVTPDILRVDAADAGRLNADALAQLRECASEVAILVHGIGLSIGSADHWNDAYLQTLDTLFNAVSVQWHSEHLGYTTVNGQFMGTMLPMPRTPEALDLLHRRCEQINRRYGVPLLLENVAPLLPDPPADFAAADFLNRLRAGGQCEVLLDLYNLECEAHNNGLDIAAFLDTIDLGNIREIHIARGVEREGLWTDVHSRATGDSTLDLLQRTLADARCKQPVVIFEFLREALPLLGVEGIAGELTRLRELITPKAVRYAA
jgi:uncharacterized protein (UPF0276 family)